MKTFKDFYNSDKVTNRFTSEDGSEAWFDYKVDNINYHVNVTVTNSEEDYLIEAWFDGLNYDSLCRHVCRFQTESKNFGKALNKIMKLCETKDIKFNGGYEYYVNTSGNRWKRIDFN